MVWPGAVCSTQPQTSPSSGGELLSDCTGATHTNKFQYDINESLVVISGRALWITIEWSLPSFEHHLQFADGIEANVNALVRSIPSSSNELPARTTTTTTRYNNNSNNNNNNKNKVQTKTAAPLQHILFLLALFFRTFESRSAQLVNSRKRLFSYSGDRLYHSICNYF